MSTCVLIVSDVLSQYETHKDQSFVYLSFSDEYWPRAILSVMNVN